MQMMMRNGMSEVKAKQRLGVNGAVLRWCREQRTQLEHNNPEALAELLDQLVLTVGGPHYFRLASPPEPVEADGGELGDAVLRWARR